MALDSIAQAKNGLFQQALANKVTEVNSNEIEFWVRLIASGFLLSDAGIITLTGAPVFPLTSLSGTLAANRGGTGLASYTIGDLLYASAATTLAALADVATGNALISGGVGAAPSWGQLTNSHIAAAAAIAMAKLSLAITNAEVDAAAAIAWSKISKTSSSLADLATRSAGDLNSGTLPDGRFPATLPVASGVNLTALNASNLASGTAGTARLGSGSASSSTYLRGDSTWAVPAGGTVTGYAVTSADVSNTTTPTNAIAFTVPANAMADGDVIVIHVAVLAKNNKGTDGTVTYKLVWGATSITFEDVRTWTNNATEKKALLEFRLMRVGSALWVFGILSGTMALTAIPIAKASGTLPAADENVQSGTPTFSSSATVALEITLSAADATFYFKPQAARAHRFAAT